jgi:hypothetical protein
VLFAAALLASKEPEFVNEDDFQQLLGKYPALLSGNQTYDGRPLRWLLIKREKSIPAEDGGFMMNSQELETAARLGLNLVVLILQDNAYGMIRWKQAADGFPDFGLTYGNPDFVAYAKAFGLKGSRVESADGLAPTLEAAFVGGGGHLVIVAVDYSESMRDLVDELRAHGSKNGER